MNSLGLTRRNWATLLVTAPVLAQVSSAPITTTQPPAAKAADEVQKVSERLAQSEVPMSLEPAFSFRA